MFVVRWESTEVGAVPEVGPPLTSVPCFVLFKPIISNAHTLFLRWMHVEMQSIPGGGLSICIYPMLEQKKRVDFVQTNPEQKKKKERPKTFIIADLIIFFFLFLVSFSWDLGAFTLQRVSDFVCHSQYAASKVSSGTYIISALS